MSNEKVKIQRIGDGRIILNNETYCKETSRRVLNHKEYEAYLKMEKETASLKERVKELMENIRDLNKTLDAYWNTKDPKPQRLVVDITKAQAQSLKLLTNNQQSDG